MSLSHQACPLVLPYAAAAALAADAAGAAVGELHYHVERKGGVAHRLAR